VKRFLACLLLILAATASRAQQVAPNVSATAILNATCTNANSACSNGVVAGANPNTPFPPPVNQGPIGSGSTLDIPVNNYSAATVTISGTYAGATVNFDFSDSTGGVLYFQEICARTDANILEVSEVVPNNQTRAWQCPVWAAYRFRIRASALTSGAITVTITLTQAAIDPSLVVASSPTVVPGLTDPCQDFGNLKSSAFANITTATTTALVAPSGSTNIYVCGYEITSSSTTTANTVILENGTGASCATSPTALSPTMSNSNAGATPVIWRRHGTTIFATGASQGLCALTTIGTAPNITVWITYVQQ
jgi:hypothetical protein